jgi:hypothetical protein
LKPNKPWGYKYTVHIYFEGEREPWESGRVLAALENLAFLKEPHFMGVSVKEIQDEPIDQVGT